ncbi:MAG TPA: spore coat protein [Firmicutes bacterium]|nr:spore coat protein [Bacillota bacterium]
MTHQLTQKERSLLQDQLAHEEICIKKYRGYANLAKSQELRNLFNELAQEELNHYDLLNRYLGGQGGQQQQQEQQQQQHHMIRGSGFEPHQFDTRTHAWSQQTQQQNQQSQGQQAGPADDAAMCQDMLMTEKFISGVYDTSVFESANPRLRRDLQKIQEDEQKHGEKIFNYMQEHGYYNPQ